MVSQTSANSAQPVTSLFQALQIIHLRPGRHRGALAGQFDTALNNMPHGLCMFRADGRLAVMNHRFGEMMKLTDEVRRTYMEKFGVRIIEAYGATECAPAVSLNSPQALRIGVVACGYADGYPRHAPSGTRQPWPPKA